MAHLLRSLKTSDPQNTKFYQSLDYFNMKAHFFGRSAKQLGCVCLGFWIVACMPLYPRLDNQGRPLTEYVYRVPDKTGDGWETTSLLDAGIDSKKINTLIRDILNLRFENIHGVLLVRNGKLVLEEYFRGYSFNFVGPRFRGNGIAYGREKLHMTASVTKSVTSIGYEKRHLSACGNCHRPGFHPGCERVHGRLLSEIHQSDR
jgi:hypothetical protein